MTLVLIDIQNDYFPGGSMELVGSTEAVAKAKEVLTLFRTKGLPVVHIQHIASRPGSTFFLPGTSGADIHHDVKPIAGEPVFVKDSPSSFEGTGLLEYVRERGAMQLYFAGMMTHMCVDTTVRAAKYLGFDSTVIHDACATRVLSFQGNTVAAKDVQTAYMAALNGFFAAVRSTEEIARDL